MSKLEDINRLDLNVVQKYIAEHPDTAHPDFDVILDALIKLEQTNQDILAQAEKYPELTMLITSVSNTLKQAQLGLADAAILHESQLDERTDSGNLE